MRKIQNFLIRCSYSKN